MCISRPVPNAQDEEVLSDHSSVSSHSHNLQRREIEEEDIPGWFEDYPPPSDSSNVSITMEEAIRLNLEEGHITHQEYEEQLQELHSQREYQSAARLYHRTYGSFDESDDESDLVSDGPPPLISRLEATYDSDSDDDDLSDDPPPLISRQDVVYSSDSDSDDDSVPPLFSRTHSDSDSDSDDEDMPSLMSHDRHEGDNAHVQSHSDRVVPIPEVNPLPSGHKRLLSKHSHISSK